MKQHKSLLTSENGTQKDADIAAFRGTELIFYGQLGLTKQADAILSEFGYGRAHFRTLYVIARNPGINSNSLVEKLKITNQSMARVMTQLLRDGLVIQEADLNDRRQRQHSLSQSGIKLEQRVRLSQFEALNMAYKRSGPAAVEGFLRVLHELLPSEDRSLLTFPLKPAKANPEP
jgi:DNA-binding MarR family transcriptional regulator